MKKLFGWTRSTVGLKVLMAVTGVLLFGFLVGHVAGNLKVFQGAEKFDAYAEALRTLGEPIFGRGQILWAARLGLIAAVGIHIAAAFRLTRLARSARRTGYRKHHDLAFTFASKTMRWGGLWILAYVLFHLADLTFGWTLDSFEHGSAYANLVGSLSRTPVAIFYVLSMIPLGMHLYHGLWSATQSLGLATPAVRRLRRAVATALALAIVLGFASVPISVVTGIVGG